MTALDLKGRQRKAGERCRVCDGEPEEVVEVKYRDLTQPNWQQVVLCRDCYRGCAAELTAQGIGV